MTTTTAKIGLLLPTRELAMSGTHDPAVLLRFAQTSEQAGFDSLWAGDSLTARPRFEPLTILTAVAAVTRRMSIGTAALTATLRHPLLAAHTLATLDQISNGRLILGLGAGFPVPETEAEFDAVGIPFRQRVSRLDETVAWWRHLWRPATGSFTGRYWQSTGAVELPPPAQPDGPPLWLSGSDTPSVLNRVARHYDGWLPFLPDPGAYRHAWQIITERATENGRDPATITPALYATVLIDPDRSRAQRELDSYVRAYYRRPLDVMSQIQAFLAGPADQVSEQLARYIDAGARHLVLRIGSVNREAQIHHIADALLPHLRPPYLSSRRPTGNIGPGSGAND